MIFEHIIDPKLELQERCRALKRVENALLRPGVLLQMKYVDAQRTVCRFEAIDGPDLDTLTVEERTRLVAAIPLMHRAVDRFRAELFADACRTVGGYIYHNYWPLRSNYKLKKKIRKKPAGESTPRKTGKSTPRQFFDTFDDGSSVWTLPSNWKKKEP